VIPDAPLPPWVIAYAEYGGQRLALAERPEDWPHYGDRRFVVFDFNTYWEDGDRGPCCDLPYYRGNDEAKARAVFEQEAEKLAGEPVRVTFVPHLLPVSRGILATIYVRTVNLASAVAGRRKGTSSSASAQAHRPRAGGGRAPG